MKDSGISWVGEIPKEWTIMPLYCFYSERKNKNIFGAENNLLSLSYGKVANRAFKRAWNYHFCIHSVKAEKRN